MVDFTAGFILQVEPAIEQAIADTIAYLPTLLAAVAVLIVGYIVGRLLGSIVARIIRRIGINRYTVDTAVEDVGSPDGVARGLGKIVAFYVYFVAIVTAADILGIQQLSSLLSELGAFLPVILGALIVLVVGFIIGRIVGDIVAGLVGDFNLGPYFRETPLERFGDEPGEFGVIVGKLVTYYVYLLTLLAVADILEITALSSLLNEFAGYLPALIGGLIVLVIGIWVAERVGELIRDIDEGWMIYMVALVVKFFIYYLTVTIALGAIGFNVTPLTNLITALVVAFFGALALASAIGIGLAIGLGGQEYVRENIDSWVRSLRRSTPDEDPPESE